MNGSTENNAYGRANVSIKINDIDAQFPQLSYSITEFDSIYSLYPKLKMIVSDYEGTINEFLGMINGTKIDVTLGQNEDSAKSCPFIVAKNAVPQQKTPSTMGGDMEIELIHEYFYTQEKTCNAFQSNISDIISKLVKKYNFTSVDIEDTINSGYWYQPFINDSEFIMNYLLPFAYSNSATNTPFYCFIDSNNVFNFKSFHNMFNQNPIKEFEYTDDGLNVVANDKAFSSIKFAQLELSKIRPFFSGEYYSYDKDGVYDFKDDSLLDYMKTNGKYPINGNSSQVTNVIPLYDYDLKADDTKNNNKGMMMNLHKECMLPDKIIINTILDKELVCGKLVKVLMPMSDSDTSTESSLRNSGNYLIESSYHIWDGTNGRTMLVCGKQNLNLNSNYRNNERLFLNA